MTAHLHACAQHAATVKMCSGKAGKAN